MVNITVFLRSENSPEEMELDAILDRLSERHEIQVNKLPIPHRSFLDKSLQPGAVQLDVEQFPIKHVTNIQEIEAAVIEVEKQLPVASGHYEANLSAKSGSRCRMTSSDRWMLWFTRHYVLLFSILLIIYAGLPFLAPILMKTGHQREAQWIYKPYRFLCHQLAYRSFFLFGEQSVYPRSIAGVEGLKTYGQATGLDEWDMKAASEFVGNETIGYKIALCQRDLAIYLSLLLFGMIFALTGKRLKPLPWWAWILFGLIPIALDGGLQMVSQLALPFLKWLPVRESTPVLRVLTGGLFGTFTAWLGYPSLEETSQTARLQLEKKAALAAALERRP